MSEGLTDDKFNALFAFGIISLVFEVIALLTVLLYFVASSSTVLLTWDKWFLVFQCTTFVSCFVVWLVGIISDFDHWYTIFLLILSILAAVGCILLLIRNQQKAFKVIYLVLTCLHYLFTWIWFLHRCGREFDFWNRDKGWVIYTLSQFLMITALFLCEAVVIFQFSAKLSPE